MHRHTYSRKHRFENNTAILTHDVLSFFGFIFWGVAWIRMRQEDYGPGWYSRLTFLRKLELLLNIFLIFVGLFMLTGGTYVRILYLSTYIHPPHCIFGFYLYIYSNTYPTSYYMLQLVIYDTIKQTN